MAKRKKDDESTRQILLTNAEIIAQQISLTMDMSIEQCALKILESANKVMTEICNKADSIKIDGYKAFEEGLADVVLTTKPFFFELVDIRRKAIYGEFDAEKLQTTAGLDEGTEWMAKHNEMRKQLIASLTKTNGEFSKVLTVAAEANTNVSFDDEAFIDWPEDIQELIDECAITRQYIDKELWPKIAMHRAAFTVYCQAEEWEFSDMLKWYHYREGGYPSKGSKPYLWEILDKFQYALRQCRKYGINIADGYLERFGLEVNITKEQVDDSAYIWDL